MVRELKEGLLIDVDESDLGFFVSLLSKQQGKPGRLYRAIRLTGLCPAVHELLEYSTLGHRVKLS